MVVTVLAIGDIIGRPGREAVARLLPQLRREFSIDLVVANGENAAGGFGLTPKIADDLFSLGIDVLTSGNHIWDQREVLTGNVQGQLFMPPIDSAFKAADEVLRQGPGTKLRLMDVHAEATSEKIALGWYLDGRVSFGVGTHTHVPAADTGVFPGGTAFVSDLGMVGPRDSVIGMDKEASLQRFLTGVPYRFKVADGPVQFNSVLVRIDALSGKADGIERVDREVEVA